LLEIEQEVEGEFESQSQMMFSNKDENKDLPKLSKISSLMKISSAEQEEMKIAAPQ